MKEPIRKPKRARKRKPHPIDDRPQFDLDQELRLKRALEEDPTENLPDHDDFSDNFPLGEGDPYLNILEGLDQDMDTPSPPPNPPAPPTLETAAETLYRDGPRACLYEHPSTREWIRKRLGELGVSNVNQLIRNYTAAQLLEGIQDFERVVKGWFPRHPNAYFRSLLK